MKLSRQFDVLLTTILTILDVLLTTISTILDVLLTTISTILDVYLTTISTILDENIYFFLSNEHSRKVLWFTILYFLKYMLGTVIVCKKNYHRSNIPALHCIETKSANAKHWKSTDMQSREDIPPELLSIRRNGRPEFKPVVFFIWSVLNVRQMVESQYFLNNFSYAQSY